MATRTSIKNNSTLTGTDVADTLTVKHQQVTVKAGKGNDKIYVNKGSTHKVYGEAGKDTITVKSTGTGMKIYGDDAKSKLTGNDTFNINGGKKNYYYGGKGVDTFNVNGGTTNYLYGGAGNDIFVIGKNSTGTAVVKNFNKLKGEADKVKVSGGAVRDIAVSGKNIIVKGGKSGSLTLENAKDKTFTVTDSCGSYAVKASKVSVKLSKDVKDTFTAPAFITTIDARNVLNENNVTGNVKANVIYVGKYTEICRGGNGNDTITVSDPWKERQQIYGDAGNDHVIINGGYKHTIYGGVGNDTIDINYGDSHSIYAGDGNDIININKGDYTVVDGGDGINTINYAKDVGETLYLSGNTNGENRLFIQGEGTINVKGDSYNNNITLVGDVYRRAFIDGNEGNDTITIACTGSAYRICAGSGDDSIIVKNGNGHDIWGGEWFRSDSGDDKIIISGGNNHTIHASDGKDVIEITGGSGHTVTLDEGTNIVTVSASNVTLEQSSYNASDKITVNWSDDIGVLKISTTSNSSVFYKDYLTIKGAKSTDFDFIKGNLGDLRNQYSLVLSSNKDLGCGIEILRWNDFKAFADGIMFDDGLKNFASINSDAGFTS